MKRVAQQDELYRPSSFWKQATLDIHAQVVEHGLDVFRSIPASLEFFVPRYGYVDNGLNAEIGQKMRDCVPDNSKMRTSVDRFLDGDEWALSDFRVFSAADAPDKRPHLHQFSECNTGCPVEQFEFDGRRFSRSSLNYLLGLCLLKRHLVKDEIATVVEIGGGFGSLGEILLSGNDPAMRYIGFDIPPNSAITQYYLSSLEGVDQVAGFEPEAPADASIHVDQLPQASAFCNWQIEQLCGKVDLFVNFISFQEMEPSIVANYLAHVDRLQTQWVLLRNMREGKQLKTATTLGVTKPVLSENYLDMLPAYELVDSNVMPFGYRTVDGYHSELLLFKRKKNH